MHSSSGPPSRGPTPAFECNPAPETSPRVQRARALSDVSGTSKHDQRRLDLDQETIWREQALDAWFESCLPGADPTGIIFEPFKVALGKQEQGMYAGLRDGASWPFVSARLQEHPDRQHDLADDLESFMHVLNYCALKHLPDAASTEAESACLTQCLYDAMVPTNSPHPKGSPLKLEKVQTGTPFVQGLPAQHPLASLLAEVSQLCKQHYEHVVLPESPPRSPSPDSIFARGSCSGADGPLPDFDGDSDLLDSRDELDGQSAPTAAPPSPSIAQSPFRSHDRMVGACMKAIRKVWPAVDRRDRPTPTRTRTRPLARTGSRVGAKHIWSASDFSEPDGIGECLNRKRARRGSESSAETPRRNAGETRTRRSGR